MSNTAPVLLVDDGELDDVRAILEEVGADFLHYRGGSVPDEVPAPKQLFIATPRRALLAQHWPVDHLPIKVGIVTEDSNTLRGMLKRIGFSLLVRRPVHPYALRLVVLRALYSGSERRRATRFPIGIEILVRSGFRHRTAVLADLSLRGARLLTSHPPKLGSRTTVQIDKKFTEAKPLILQGKIVRISQEPIEGDKHTVGLQFEALSKETQKALSNFLQKAKQGPLPLADHSGTPSAEESGAELPLAAAATPENRRKHERAAFEREVVQLDNEASSVLLGHDISMGGMRIESETRLEMGDQLRLAIYGGPREDPFIVRANVVRQESAHTYGLQFDALKPAVANRLEALVARLPAVESLQGDESDALGSVVSRILTRDLSELGNDD